MSMMIRRILPVVAAVSSCINNIGNGNGNGIVGADAAAITVARAAVEGDGEGDGIDIDNIDFASTIQLAQETIDRFVPTHNSAADADASTDQIDDDTASNDDDDSQTKERTSSADATATSNKEEEVQDDSVEDDADADLNLTYDGSDLIEWINSNGGFVHPNARIGLDPTGQYRGVFVKDAVDADTAEGGGNGNGDELNGGIEEGDIIARIPWDLIIKPKDYSQHTFWSCEALRELHHQFILGDESKYAPYVNYLKNQPRGRIPSEWTPAGKKLLSTILDHNTDDPDSEDVGLPPRYFLKSFEDTWMKECGGQDTELARAAFYQFTSRDEDTLMVPFYDMHNHSNDPKKLNTISIKPKRNGKPFVLKSIRDIDPGEQLLISYNRCNQCWFDKEYEDCVSYSHYGTMHMFDIFGFVEEFPQSWHFRAKIEEEGRVVTDDLKFCLERSEEDGDLVVTFGDNYSKRPSEEQPVEGNIVWLGEQLVRLKGLEDAMKTDEKVMETVPGHEWYMMWRYHEALMTSISAAILASGFGGSADEEGGEDAEGSEDEEASEDDSEDGSSDDEEDEDEGEPDESRESDDNNEDEGEPEKIEEVRDEL